MGCCTSKQPATQKPLSSAPNLPSRPPASSAPASFSSRYRVEARISVSAFTTRLKATFLATGQLRFIKVIHKSALKDSVRLQEMDILRTLDHPNVLRLLEILEDPVNYYLCSEYAEGNSLLAFISSRRLISEAHAAEVMYQVLSAVAYCHSKGVVHRDIRPEHIVVQTGIDRWNLKLADFGCATMLDPHRQLTGVMGSTFFLAPEVIRGSYNEKCDLWSCGILMFLLLTGNYPYGGQSEKEAMQALMNDRTDIKITGISNEAQQLLYLLLCKNPKERASASEALQHYWISSRTSHSTDLSPVLQRLKSFTAKSQLRDALLTYISTRVTTDSDSAALLTAFRALDQNGDGTISRNELQSASTPLLSDIEVKSILSELDSNHDGRISYSEFLRAARDQRKTLSRRNLEQAFRSIDQDQDGVLSVEELKQALPSLWSDEQWAKLIAEADNDRDGVIDIKEFTTLLLKQDR